MWTLRMWLKMRAAIWDGVCSGCKNLGTGTATSLPMTCCGRVPRTLQVQFRPPVSSSTADFAYILYYTLYLGGGGEGNLAVSRLM